MNVDRMMWGALILSVSLGLLALLAIYSSMPSPHRAVTPPPLDQDGHTYTCYCYATPVRVQIQTPHGPARAAGRRRRARRAVWPRRRRVRPISDASHAGADCGGRGVAAASVAA